MVAVGPCNYVVILLNVGGSKVSDMKLVLQREPRTRKTWYHDGFVLHDDEHVDAAIRELH
jgi:hypothetical protein